MLYSQKYYEILKKTTNICLNAELKQIKKNNQQHRQQAETNRQQQYNIKKEKKTIEGFASVVYMRIKINKTKKKGRKKN